MNTFLVKISLRFISLAFFCAICFPTKAFSQPIVPAPDGTGTTINQRGNTVDINGGSRSADAQNLFHSFERFNVLEGQTANFISTPNTQNILGRVVGGEASLINGSIQITGSHANLFLMNPAGIVFGANASLNIPADLTITTANGIGFNGNWFNSVGSPNYTALVGMPSEFNLSALQPGMILNQANLTVKSGQNLTLLSNVVINTGQLDAPAGKITIAAMTGGNLVKVSQSGHLLSLELPSNFVNSSAITPLSLPQLLTGNGNNQANSVAVLPNGSIQLMASNIGVTAQSGTIFIPSNTNVSTSVYSQSSQVNMIGDQINIPAGIGNTFNSNVANFTLENKTELVANNLPQLNNLLSKEPAVYGSVNNPVNISSQFVATNPPVTPILSAPNNIAGLSSHQLVLAADDHPIIQNNVNQNLMNNALKISGNMPAFKGEGGVEIDQIPPPMLNSLNFQNSAVPAVPLAQNISTLEESRRLEFFEYFGKDTSNSIITTESVRDVLDDIQQQTGTRSAIIYVTALPEQLNLVVFTANGSPHQKTVSTVNRTQLLNIVQRFRSEITSSRYRNSNQYLKSAQQLYELIIEPIEAELKAANIDTILFSMDGGLRSLPVAALHDGQQFLVEKYSLSLIPSVSLMDTRYKTLKNSQVLGMGASQFVNLNPLPAVPVELNMITQQLWSGKAYLDQEFTKENLIHQRKQYPYPIIHLATHGEFQAGDQSNSYIQLWGNEKLRLDGLRELKWNNPPVELLVLSACRTALGDEQAELGFAGLAVQAGVKSALASLWYVSDEGTLGLMIEFYSHLRDVNIKAEALRQAQLAMIHGQVTIKDGQLKASSRWPENITLPAELATAYSDLSHPYYWSGFTMIGSPW